jgi:hypothetical protein
VRAHLETLSNNGGFARVIVRVTPSDVADVGCDLRRLRDSYEERFRALFEQLSLAPGADRTLLRLMLLGALNHSQTWFKRGPGRTGAAAIAHQFVGVLRQGVAA